MTDDRLLDKPFMELMKLDYLLCRYDASKRCREFLISVLILYRLLIR
jgi:hypothetical protein